MASKEEILLSERGNARLEKVGLLTCRPHASRPGKLGEAGVILSTNEKSLLLDVD